MRRTSIPHSFAAVATSCVLATVGCGSGQGDDADGGGSNQESAQGDEPEGDPQDDSDGSQQYPDIEDVQVEKTDETTADLSVTVSSPYDTPERYADGWRVLDQDDEVLGEHTLMHDHAEEQPFTRTQSGVTIPDGTQELTIEGRDLENGYGGETVTVDWN